MMDSGLVASLYARPPRESTSGPKGQWGGIGYLEKWKPIIYGSQPIFGQQKFNGT